MCMRWRELKRELKKRDLKLCFNLQIFFTGKGYGVVTPETYWKTSVIENEDKGCLLLTNEEALARAHGIVESYPHGNVVDKAIQTNLVDVICRGNGSDKVLYGRTLEEMAPQATSQRHRSLRMFHVSSSRRMSWSELRGGSSASSGGSLRLSQSKAKKLMEECDGPDLDLDDWGVHRVHPPSKSNKGLSISLLLDRVILVILFMSYRSRFWKWSWKPVQTL